MPDFSTILCIPEVRALVQEKIRFQKQVMAIQPKIHSFSFKSSSYNDTTDDPAMLNVAIAVPDGIVGATLLAHITALVSQYKVVQKQVEAAEVQPKPQSVVPDVEPSDSADVPLTDDQLTRIGEVIVETPKRTTPAKPKKSPPRVENIPTDEPADEPVVETKDEDRADSGQTVAENSVVDTPEPDGSGETCPADLVKARTMKHVLEWMVAHSYTTVDMIVAKCEEYKSQCPAISRAKSSPDGDLTERVERGLVYLKTRGAIA